MKNTMKRLLVAMLALMLLGTAMLPAALAVDNFAVANANRGSIYAGMKDTIVLTNSQGVKLDNRSFRWKSSNSRVVSVNSKGEIWGKKPNASATITATNKSNRNNKVKITIKVQRNKVDNLVARPSATAARYENWLLLPKSIEIMAPDKVVVEYYVVCNFPSNWQTNKINWLQDTIKVHDLSTREYICWLINGKASSISGFKKRWGQSVQVVKATYSGKRIGTTNFRAQLKAYSFATNGNMNYKIRR